MLGRVAVCRAGDSMGVGGFKTKSSGDDMRGWTGEAVICRLLQAELLPNTDPLLCNFLITALNRWCYDP
jgi:hypothetical protein